MRLVALALLLLPLLAAGENDADGLIRKYKEIKGDIINQEEAKRKVLADLFKVTLGMKKINKRREHLMNEKHYVETRIHETSTALDELKGDLDEQRGLLRARMRGLYKYNGQNVMRLIFSSQTPSDLDRNLKILKIVADKDYILIRAYEKNLATYSRESKKLQGHRTRLASIETELKSHENDLLVQQNEKNRIVEGFDKTTISQLLKLERIREQSSKISQVQSDPTLRITQSFFEARGKLNKPVDGELLQGFGLLEDLNHGVKLRFKGIYVGAPVGTEVRSVFAGEVLFNDVVPGLGPTLVLAHGDHYYTVYGNNSEVFVRRGQRVSTGDVIGRSGSNWHQMNTGSYFEIRHFSDLIDPGDWFDKGVL